MVYVNYGRVEDLQKLKDLGVKLYDQILVARYGKIYAGNKVRDLQGGQFFTRI